jgi:hypothetical protein
MLNRKEGDAYAEPLLDIDSDVQQVMLGAPCSTIAIAANCEPM